MANFSFTPPAPGRFGGGLGGWGGLGLGSSLFDAITGGLQLSDSFRKNAANSIIDQFRVPALSAGYANQMWNSEADRGENASRLNYVLMRLMQDQGYSPEQGPGGFSLGQFTAGPSDYGTQSLSSVFSPGSRGFVRSL